MTPITCLKILSFNSHSNFHRRAANEIHAALHYHEIAKMNRLAEVDSVDRCGNAGVSRVPYGTHRRCCIHHAENDATEHQSKIVRVLRQHEL